MFNAKKYKLAQQRGQYPPAMLPDARARWSRMRQDPYKLDRNPGDGQGQKLTTPGSAGMLGDSPDAGVGFGGSNERDGYPRGTSQYEDSDAKRPQLPKDSDPDDPFASDMGQSEYGQGQGTDYGQAFHDEGNLHESGDSVLGIHNMVMNDVSGNDRDRKTDIANMPSSPHNTVRPRMPYNQKNKSSGPLGVVRDSQMKRRR